MRSTDGYRVLVRILTTAPGPGETVIDITDGLSDADLDQLYAPPRTSWLRTNMVSTLDGAATGADDKSGGINNAADKRVFACLRRLADAVLVGAGTARAEEYAPLAVPVVVVSRRGEVPPTLRGADRGRVLMVTCADAEHLAQARDLLGARQVLVTGQVDVELVRARQELASRGLTHLLSEGGPHPLRDLAAQGVLDELDLTIVPRLISGDHPRILTGPPVDATLRLRLMLEDEGTLLMRWTV